MAMYPVQTFSTCTSLSTHACMDMCRTLGKTLSVYASPSHTFKKYGEKGQQKTNTMTGGIILVWSSRGERYQNW